MTTDQPSDEHSFEAMRRVLLAAVGRHCDGSFSDDPADWTLTAGRDAELSIEDLVAALARASLEHLHDRDADPEPVSAPGP